MTRSESRPLPKLNTKLTSGPIFKSLFLFMLPIFFSSLFQQLYNTVDIMIVGNVLGDQALAAIGACGAIYELLVGFGLGIGNGLAIVAARCYGAQDEDGLKRTVAGSMVIGVGASLTIMLAGLLGLRPLLELLDTPAEIIGDAYAYIRIIALGVPVMFAYNLCSGLLRAIGNSMMPLVFLLLSSVLNVGLDIWFIAGLGLGVPGAAAATVLAQGVSAALCVVYILRRTPVLLPAQKHFEVGAQRYQELLTQGLSMGLMSSIVSAGSVVLQYGINGLGTLVIAGAYGSPQAVCGDGYAADRHGLSSVYLCVPEFWCRQPGPGAQGDAGCVYLLGGGGHRRSAADVLQRGVDGAGCVRLCRGGGGAERCKVSDVECTFLRSAGCAAVHPVCAAEPGTKGAAAAVQRHRAGGQDLVRAVLHPPLWL